MEKEKLFKAWYFDAHDEVITEEIIHGTPESTLELAYMMAGNIAYTHYPECVRIECLEVGKRKTSVLEH